MIYTISELIYKLQHCRAFSHLQLLAKNISLLTLSGLIELRLAYTKFPPMLNTLSLSTLVAQTLRYLLATVDRNGIRLAETHQYLMWGTACTYQPRV